MICASAVAMMATVGLFFLLAGYIISGGQNVRVPNLVGKSIVEAHMTLKESGLTLELNGSRYSSIVPKDSIISQDPAPGRVVKSSRKIRVVLSRGTENIVVPDVTGRDVRYAAVTLSEAGFRVGTEVRVHYPARADIVVGQDPPADRPMPRDSEVALLVSRGAPRITYVMPYLVGMSLDEAADVLNKLNINIRAEYETAPKGVPEGVLFYQDPLPHTAVVEGDTVIAKVSKTSVPQELARWESLEGAVFRFDVPPGLVKRRVRIQVQDAGGRSTEFDRLVNPGTTITVPILYLEWLDVETEVDGRVVQTEFVRDGRSTVVPTKFTEYVMKQTRIAERPLIDVADEAIRNLLHGTEFPGDYIGNGTNNE